ncbi:MAG: peptidoglycan DD-metalloendopeptidase family protein [Candidatus Omnitrophica bacterium]|nr:peptidoglycan DD-metalloendopeptidase family protein [Candidatus Omnitrophota bacterium]
MRVLALVVLVIFLAGCATTAQKPLGAIRASTTGFYHEVQRGQTLWQIARIYDIDLKKIIQANRLPNASNIEVGQLIFVPGAHGQKTEAKTTVTAKKLENFIWPVRGRVISYFGSMKKMAVNNGIDIAVKENAPVFAARSGRVTFCSDNMEGYGRTIIVDHLDGFETVYAQNSENLVKVEQPVKQGETIARTGKSGRAEAVSLHFEIRKNHKPQNPFYYLP